MITGSAGFCAWIDSKSAMPSMPLMRRSVTTTRGRATRELRERALGAFRRGDGVARRGEPDLHEPQQIGIVVDDQDARTGRWRVHVLFVV